MVNALRRLTSLSGDDLVRLGIEHAPREIAAQPGLWLKNFEMLREREDEIRSFVRLRVLRRASPRVILAGAGTSAFIGLSAQNLLRSRWQVDIDARATTDLVTHWDSILLRRADNTLISFARSGNSPESLGAILLTERVCGEVSHIIVTCNEEGRLARLGRERRNALLVVLSPETNDRSLAMTSSFSTMLMAAQFLAYVDETDRYGGIVRDLSEATEGLFENYSGLIEEISRLDFERGVFLGSGALYGCAVESHLKLQEMTGGRVVCKPDSFLGLRHGPEAIIDGKTLVVYFLSTDPFVRRYELDLMKDVSEKGIGMRRIAVCDRPDGEIESYVDHVVEFNRGEKFEIPDLCRPVMDVTVGQMLGLFKSLALNLKPDNPSPQGVITRVVKGVRIYDYEAFKSRRKFEVIAGS